MGCDIHIFAEVKIEGKWEVVKEKVFKGYQDEPTSEPFGFRSYDTFAILANVRNGRGFAGVKTGEGFIPISEPKGLPDDVSEKVKGSAEHWDLDGHSHSYHTLKDLLDYNWNQYTMKRGWITLDQYKKLKETGEKWPSSWAGGVSMPNIEHLEEDEADRLLDNPELIKEGKNYFVNYRWTVEYKESSSRFYGMTIPALQALGKPEDVRIVFWFDS